MGWVVADVRSQNQNGLTKPEDSISYKKFVLGKIITYMEMIGILLRQGFF